MTNRIIYIVKKFYIIEISLSLLFIISVFISVHSLILFSRFDDLYPGFFTYSNSMVSITQRNTWGGIGAGLKPLDIVLEVNGIKVNGGIDILRIIREFPPGSEFNYKIMRGGEVRSVNVKSAILSLKDKIFTFYLPFSIGLLFLLIGGVVFFIRITERANRVFLIFCALIAIFYTTGFDVNTTYTYSRIWLLYPFFGAASLHLFLIFPEERKRIKQYPSLLIVPYAIVGIPVLFHEIFYNSYRASFFFFKAIPPLMGLLFFLDIAVLSYTAIKTTSFSVRHKAKALIIAVLCASTFGVLWSLTFPLRSQYVTLDRAVILSTVFPIFMTYAILKENIFDIDRFIQNTMIYSILSGILVGVYFLVVGVIGFFTQKVFLIGHTPFENILSVLAIVILFHPLRVSIQRFIRKTFYMDELRVQSELIELLTELWKVMDVGAIADKIVQWIKKNLKFDSSFYIVKEERLVKVRSTLNESPDFIMLPPQVKTNLLKYRPFLVTSGFVAKKKTEPELRYFFRALNNTVIIPIIAGNRFLGIVGAGKLGVDSFIRKLDEEIFKIIGENTGLFVENAINYAERTRKEHLATIGKMGTVIIHEIKNPLSIIKSAAQTLKKRLEPKEPEKELLEYIEEEADRINNTVRRVLDYAKPTEPMLNSIDIGDIAKKTVKMMDSLLQDAKVVTKLDIPDEPVLIQGDPNLLHQAFLNILRNSIDEMKNGGSLYIKILSPSRFDSESTTTDGFVGRMKELGARVIRSFTGTKNVVIIIEDDGPGIRMEDKDKIFEPFYSTKHDGTGLGLAITKQIIESHHGTIRAENRQEKGTRFIIEIPVDIK
jgi:signal transduction histidine kinase